jgi:hypothetical protein
MGESRDAVKAATEIGVIMMGRPVQNNHRHSVSIDTFQVSSAVNKIDYFAASRGEFLLAKASRNAEPSLL